MGRISASKSCVVGAAGSAGDRHALRYATTPDALARRPVAADRRMVGPPHHRRADADPAAPAVPGQPRGHLAGPPPPRLRRRGVRLCFAPPHGLRPRHGNAVGDAGGSLARRGSGPAGSPCCVCVPPALASNDAAMRLLRRGWKRVQRLAYPAALLTLAHWMLVHDGLASALVQAAPLLLLQAWRLARHFHQPTTQRKIA